MTRLLAFSYIENEYIIQENSEIIFRINADDLKFDSLKFYLGLYQNHNISSKIILQNNITNDQHKKGSYIFQWINRIIENIYIEFNEYIEADSETDESMSNSKIIPLFEWSVCAGNGFYIEGESPSEEYESENLDADFAIKISGKSMEPTIPDGSIALISNDKDLDHEDIGIFVLDGEVMCKRYLSIEGDKYLVADNESDEFKHIKIGENNICNILGKVLDFEK